MKIAGYIGDLLYEYECVVIPGLGGFLTRDHTASIHPVRHYFKPPYREIVFNPLLRANDGLLLSHIARSENLTYQEAKSRIDRFVLTCLAKMEEGKRIHFRKIGSIYYTDEKEVVFKADENMNYLPDSFGLAAIVSPPIKREDFQQKIETVFHKPPQKKQAITEKVSVPQEQRPKPSKPQPFIASQRKNRLRNQINWIAAALVIMLGVVGYMNKEKVQQYYQNYSSQASLWPIFYASPNEYLIKNKDLLQIEPYVWPERQTTENKGALKPGQNDLQSEESYKASFNLLPDMHTEKTGPVASSEQELVEEHAELADASDTETIRDILPTEEEDSIRLEPYSSEAVTEKKFFIIAGAFQDKSNAEKLIHELRVKGFEADFTGQTKTGLWRVCFEGFTDHSMALQRLQLIKKEENPQAWLLIL
ncbi:MAG: SPOR domain-containing protein [Bacteroidales bacterium]|nr:SPOR domain-containing protein [Bacteroidales bacterium]